MNQTPDDKALNEYLSGQSPISARYRELSADDVPPELDAAILAQAKSAVANSSSHTKLERWRRWTVPTTLAATFVLVVSLVIQNNFSGSLQDNSPITLVGTPEIIAEKKEEESAVTVDLALTSPTLQEDSMPEVSASLPVKLDMPSPPTPLADSSGATATQSPIESTASVKLTLPDPREAAPATAPIAQRPPPAAPAPVAASAPTPLAEESARMAKAMEQRSVANQMQSVSRRSDSPQQITERREADPKLWLEYIRELRKENKTDDANREWENFRKRYPEFKVESNDVARGSTP
jgi:negative regulator of sigma E activity